VSFLTHRPVVKWARSAKNCKPNWQYTTLKAHEIRFVRGRLKFGDGHQSAPFPSMIAVFLPLEVRATIELELNSRDLVKAHY